LTPHPDPLPQGEREVVLLREVGARGSALFFSLNRRRGHPPA